MAVGGYRRRPRLIAERRTHHSRDGAVAGNENAGDYGQELAEQASLTGEANGEEPSQTKT